MPMTSTPRLVAFLAPLLAVLAGLAACAAAVPPAAVQAPAAGAPVAPDEAAEANGGMRARVERFSADRQALSRFYPLDATPERAERQERFAADGLAELAAVDFDALDLDGKVDGVLLRLELEHEAYEAQGERARLERLSALLPCAAAIGALEEARGRVEPLDPAAAAATLDALAKDQKALAKRVVRANAESPPEDALKVSGADALWLAGRVDGLGRTLSEWYRHYDTYRPDFAWWCAEPKKALAEALEAYAKELREEVAGQKGEDGGDGDPLVGDPIGREALEAELRHELLPYTPEELIALGERELAWCEGELKAAAGDMGLGEDWRAALERVKAQHVPPGEQDALVADLAREAIAWLDDRDLVTIPPLCRETWRVRMIPREDQRFFPFAFYGGQTVDVAYPTSDMDQESKQEAMRGNNVHFTRAVTPHELIPGHHLQGFMAQRYNPHRGAFSTPFLVEGWALYWEMLEWDLGWPRSPEDRVGMLFWRMHRAARIVVSLDFHLGLMTAEQMVDFLVERVGHERDNATAEVRRYIGGSYGPLYQCAYMVGGLQLLALRRETVDTGRMTDREFHDAVLQAGPIPIEMIRALLTGEPPARDHAASWRFEGGPR